MPFPPRSSSVCSLPARLAVVVAAGFVAAAWMSAPSVAQVQPGQPQPAPTTQPDGPPPEVRTQIDGFRKTIQDRLRLQLEASEDEFAVLQPRIEKINRMLMASDTQMVGMTFVARAFSAAQTRPAGEVAPAPGTPRPPNPAMAAMKMMFGDFDSIGAYQRAEALSEALERPDASIDTLRGRLNDLREARRQTREELKRAREELRGLCTARQEAMLVLLGILD